MSNLYTTSISATTQSITVCPIQPLAVSGAVISPFTAGFTYLPLLNVININPLITYAGYYNYMKAAINMKTYSYGRKQLGNLPVNGGAQPWTGGLTVPGMRLWLDGKDPLAGTTPSAGTLSTWFDKSGNGYNAAATGTPSWSTSGVSVSTANYYTSTYSITGNTETSFVVFSYPAGNAFNAFTTLGGASAGNRQISKFNLDIEINKSGTALYKSAVNIQINTMVLLTGAITPTTITSYINGVQGTTSNSTYTFVTGNTLIGSYQPGTISEVIIYSNALNDTQRQSVEAYLMNKWNIAFPTPALWLDGADPYGTGVVPRIGTTIPRWFDKSGNGDNGILTGTLKWANGIFIPTVTANTYDMNYRVTANTETIVIVVSFADITSSGSIIDSGATDGRKLMLDFSVTPKKITYSRGDNTVYYTLPVTPEVNKPMLIIFTLTPTSITGYVNGIASTTTSIVTSISATANTQISGSSSYTAKTFYEVLLYKTVLSTTQRQSVEQYLMNKWGIQQVPTRSIVESIAPDLALWLDGADPLNTGSPPALNSPMTTWVDKSGNGRTVTCSAANVKYVNGVFNSNGPGIRVSIPAGTFLGALNAFVVYQTVGPSGPSGGTVITRGDNNYGNPLDLQDGATSMAYVGPGGGSAWALKNYNLSNATRSLFNININQATQASSSVTIFTNGTPVTLINTNTPTWTPSDSGSTLVIGGRADGGLYAIQTFYEVLVYNTVLTSAQRQGVEQYLMNKWAIPQGPAKNISGSLTSGLALWLDGADPLKTGSPPAVGTAVPTWFDKSGNGLNGSTAGTGTPTWANGIVLNGAQYYSVPYSGLHPAETCFIVANITSPGTATNYLLGGSTNATRGFGTYINELFINKYITENNAGTNNAPVRASTTTLFGYSYSSTAGYVYVNGIVGGVTTTGMVPASDTATFIGSLNGNSPMAGTMCEVILYSNVLSTTQRQSVEQYLMNKWNIISVPSPNQSLIQSIPVNLTGLSVFSNLQIWLDGSDPYACGVVPANGTTIPTWFDKSGNGYNAAGIASPTWSNGIVLNSNSTQYYTIPYAGSHLTETGFIVASFSTVASSTANRMSMITGGPSYSRAFLINDDAGTVKITNQGVGTIATTPITFTSNINVLLEYTVTSVSGNTTGNIYINGIFASSGSSINQLPADTTLYIGTYGSAVGQFCLNGTVSEVLIYNSVLSSNDRQSVESYLMNKWNINYSNVPGLAIWLDGQDPLGTGSAPATGSSVPVWYDKSGNGYNGTATGVPTWSNGIVFNGAPYYTLSYPGTHWTETGFIVASFATVASSTANRMAIFAGVPTDARTVWINDTAGTFSIGNAGITSVVSTAITFTSNAYVLLEYTVTGVSGSTSGTLYTNGTLGTTASSVRTLPVDTNITIGAQIRNTTPYAMNGTIQEIMIYNSVLTTTQRQLIEGYLATKWSLQSSLPAGHPYLSTPVTGYNPRNQYSTPSNVGYLAVPQDAVSMNPPTSVLSYDGTSWSVD